MFRIYRSDDLNVKIIVYKAINEKITPTLTISKHTTFTVHKFISLFSYSTYIQSLLYLHVHNWIALIEPNGLNIYGILTF
jgi:hypothetical protein